MRSPVPQSKRNPEMNADGDFEDFDVIPDEVFDPMPPTKPAYRPEDDFVRESRPAQSPASVGDARVRLIIANGKIMANHTAGSGWSDEEIIRQEGFGDWNGYWKIALAQEMKVSDFVFLLETHMLDPDRTAREIKGAAITIRMLITSSLREAFENHESWLFQAKSGSEKLEDYRVRPREAAEWFLSRPLDRDRLPEKLRAFLRVDDVLRESPAEVGAAPSAPSNGDGRDPGASYRTGAPGRPSPMYLVEAEAKRRRSLGETVPEVTGEASALFDWFKDNHPKLPPPKPKTIRNKISSDHRTWKANARN
jgi:hypothetical protein